LIRISISWTSTGGVTVSGAELTVAKAERAGLAGGLGAVVVAPVRAGVGTGSGRCGPLIRISTSWTSTGGVTVSGAELTVATPKRAGPVAGSGRAGSGDSEACAALCGACRLTRNGAAAGVGDGAGAGEDEVAACPLPGSDKGVIGGVTVAAASGLVTSGALANGPAGGWSPVGALRGRMLAGCPGSARAGSGRPDAASAVSSSSPAPPGSNRDLGRGSTVGADPLPRRTTWSR
jgi:hypothetical protein